MARGFDRVQVFDKFYQGERGAATPIVEGLLSQELDRERPLFLVVNICLAHSPYERVPPEAGWTPATKRSLSVYRDGLFDRYTRDQMPPDEKQAFLAELKSGYDWGVRLADDDLARLMRSLEEDRWVDNRSVVAVTSDHGELLGEHGLLDHGRTVVRENIDVFAVVRGGDFQAGRKVDHLVQSQDLFPTLLKAAGLPAPEQSTAVPLQSPRPDRLAITVNQPERSWILATGGRLGAKRFVAVQRRDLRVVWTDPDTLQGEKVPGISGRVEATEADPTLGRVARQVGEAARTVQVREAVLPPDTLRNLRSLGYVQ
jgi:arylsulfatase A-like enzyme